MIDAIKSLKEKLLQLKRDTGNLNFSVQYCDTDLLQILIAVHHFNEPPIQNATCFSLKLKLMAMKQPLLQSTTKIY